METKQPADCWFVLDGSARFILQLDGSIVELCDLAKTLVEERNVLFIRSGKLYLKHSVLNDRLLHELFSGGSIRLMYRDDEFLLLASFRKGQANGSLANVLVIRPVQMDGPLEFVCLAEAFGLTPTEERIALHLLTGSTPSAIARLEAVSVNTVRCHVSHIYTKLGTRNREQMWVKCAPFMVSRAKTNAPIINSGDANHEARSYQGHCTQLN